MRNISTIIATIAVLAFTAPAFAGGVSSAGSAGGPGNSAAARSALGPGISQTNCLGDIVSSRAPGGPKDPYASITDNISFIFTTGLSLGLSRPGMDCSTAFNEQYP